MCNFFYLLNRTSSYDIILRKILAFTVELSKCKYKSKNNYVIHKM